jgi:acylglycerol lipase
MRVSYEETEYLGYDGKQMFMRVWSPDGEPKAIVLGVHGLGSHSGLLSFVAEHFAQRGYKFYAPDMRGFGHYDGLKGHIDYFDEYIKDLEALLAHIKLKHSVSKFFMYGHSLGGLWTARYAIQHGNDLDGIVLASPAVSDRLKIGGATRALLKGLSRLNVKMLFGTGLDLDLIARNPEVVRRNKEDPLRFDKVTPRGGAEGLKAKEEVFNQAHLITIPVLVQQSEDDLIVIPEMSKDFYDRISSKDKSWKSFPGLYHEPFEDKGGDEYLNNILDWLDAHSS